MVVSGESEGGNFPFLFLLVIARLIGPGREQLQSASTYSLFKTEDPQTNLSTITKVISFFSSFFMTPFSHQQAQHEHNPEGT